MIDKLNSIIHVLANRGHGGERNCETEVFKLHLAFGTEVQYTQV